MIRRLIILLLIVGCEDDSELESMMPEPGDEVFLLRNMEEPEKLLRYLQ
jgi:hypothetical protein